jgi:hypothetical protein
MAAAAAGRGYNDLGEIFSPRDDGYIIQSSN